MNASSNRQGFVLVVTILVVGIVVAAFVTAASVSMVGARRGAAFERVAYQALRVAENAVNTFPDLLASAGYEGSYTASAIDSWIAQDNTRASLRQYSDASGTAVIALRPSGVAGAVTVVATSTVEGSTKTVLRDVARTIGPPLNPGALAPLTSLPSVDIRGNATLTGQDYMGSNGMLALGNVLSAGFSDGTTTVTVDNGFLLRPGFHMDIGGKRFRVETVEPVEGSSSASAVTMQEVYVGPMGAAVSEVNVADLVGAEAASVPLAVGSELVAGGSEIDVATGTIRIQVPHGGSVRVGSCVRLDLAFAGDAGVYTAEVTSVEDVTVGDGTEAEAVLDFNSGTCTESSAVPPTTIATIPAGTAIVSDVVSVESAQSISSGGNAELVNGSRPESDWLAELIDPTDFRPDDLFEEVFGMTKEDFVAFATTSGTVLSGIAAKDTRYDGVTYAPNGADNKAFCGNGFIVIEGDVKFTAGNQALGGECDGETGFSGIVYITGDFTHQGNSEFRGSVIVQGRTILEEDTTSIGDEETEVRGTGRKVTYDLAAILAAGNLLPTFQDPGWVAGSWRQE